MSQGNKIDFTIKSEQYNSGAYYKDGDNWPTDIFMDAFVCHLDDPDFDRIVLFIVTIAYMRITTTNAENQFHIPANASLDTLKYSEGQNFYNEIFKRFVIICETNEVLSEIPAILESYFMAGAYKASRESNSESILLEVDWSESGFGKRHSSLYVNDELLAWRMVDNDRANLVKELSHLAPLLNIQSEERQLCTPFLYITYLANLFEQSGWGLNDCETLANTYLNNVIAVQVEPVLRAIQTLQVVLFGCNKQLISKTDELSTIYNQVLKNVEERFDVIFLPEASHDQDNDYYWPDSMPDVGPIHIWTNFGNIVIEKKSSWYDVAFLYNLLNDKGRMFVKCRAELLKSGKNNEVTSDNHLKLLAFFVDNNLIETMIQTENCVYMLIDKNRPETKHGKILFYYLQDFKHIGFAYPQENDNPALRLSLEEYSCEYIKLRHDEGAVIVSNQEIRLNDYCLLPKRYIYDFDRVKQLVESDMIQHIRHEANQLIPRIGRSLKSLGLFLNKHGLDNEPSQEKRDEDDIVPSVKELIEGSRNNLLQLQSVFTAAREVVLESFDKSNFKPCDLNKLFAEISNYQGQKKYSIQVKGTLKSSPIIYENAFRDMIENIISNAENHGFKDDRSEYRIVFDLSQKGRRIVIKCMNNGEPLPRNFTKDKLFAKGDKGPNSTGMGLGGERIGKILAAHDAGFDVLPIGRLPQGFTVGFEITLSIERESNEQG